MNEDRVTIELAQINGTLKDMIHVIGKEKPLPIRILEIAVLIVSVLGIITVADAIRKFFLGG